MVESMEYNSADSMVLMKVEWWVDKLVEPMVVLRVARKACWTVPWMVETKVKCSAVWIDEKMGKQMERHLVLRWVDQKAARWAYKMVDWKDLMMELG
jgi:hypothetical protein